MRVLLVTETYPPEIRSASHLMLELAEELSARGHQISVVTTWPQYNLDRNKELQDFKEVEIENGIKVLRIKTLPLRNVSYLVRGLVQLFVPLQFLWKLYRKGMADHDVVLVYSPPLPMAFIGTWFRWRGQFNLLNVQDLFPQNGIDLEILTHPLHIQFFKILERWAYRTADVVTVHSQGNRQMVVEQHPDCQSKFKILHNWVDVDYYAQPLEGINFRERFSITHPFIFVFAGVIGPSQYLGLVLKIAEKMQDYEDVLFLLVGDGSEKEALLKQKSEMGLNNVMFQPFISRDDYPALLKISSVGIICLSPKNKTPVVPGKLLGYMAASLPVVALINKQSDGHAIVKEAECGYSANSDDFEASLAVARQLYEQQSQLKTMGARGKEYARVNFSKEVCVSKLETFFNS